MSFEDQRGKLANNEKIIQQITSVANPYEPGKIIAQCDKSSKLNLTQMNNTVAQNVADKIDGY